MELHEKVALVRSWVDHLEQRVRGPRKSPSEAVTKAVVLERLEGFVDQIDGPVAYVTLKSQYGDELTGEYASDELAAQGIQVNCVAPGLMRTEMLAKLIDANPEKFSGRVPMKRVGLPEEIARSVVFLCGSGSDYMTGATVDVSGGLAMH